MDSWSPAAPGELSTQSEEFRTRSAAHNVRLHQTGAKHVHHPVVGDLSLTFEMLELRADPGLTILSYTAEPGSKSVGTEAVIFPSHHAGFLGGEFGMQGNPDAFAATLREVLSNDG